MISPVANQYYFSDFGGERSLTFEGVAYAARCEIATEPIAIPQQNAALSALRDAAAVGRKNVPTLTADFIYVAPGSETLDDANSLSPVHLFSQICLIPQNGWCVLPRLQERKTLRLRCSRLVAIG